MKASERNAIRDEVIELLNDAIHRGDKEAEATYRHTLDNMVFLSDMVKAERAGLI